MATPKKTSTNHATTTEMSSTSPEAVQPQHLQPQSRPKEKEQVNDHETPPPNRQPGSQVTSAEDISLLEAKLQRIDATRAFPNSPSAPVLAEVF